MTDELIESVARAICESKPDRAGFWETTPEPRRKGYRTQARAAVVAVLKGIRPNQKATWAMQTRHRIDKLLAQIEGGNRETN